jgi:hypothetical protein
MVATELEIAPRILTIDYRERPAERVLVGARGSELQLRVEACAEQDLVGVVRETMQPAHLSLWLRPSSSGVEDTEEK